MQLYDGCYIKEVVAGGLFCIIARCKFCSLDGVDPYETARSEWQDGVDCIHVEMYLLPSPHTQEKNLDCLSGWVREVLARVFGEKLQSNHVMHNTIVGEC